MSKATIKVEIATARGSYRYRTDADFQVLKHREASIEIGRIVLDSIDVSLGGVGILSGHVTVTVGDEHERFHITPDFFEGSRLEKGTTLGSRIISAAYALSEKEGN